MEKTVNKGRAMPAPTNRFEFRQKFQKRNGQAHSLQGAGRDFAPNQHNFTGCETLWFVPLSRYRAGAKNVYVHSQSATEKTTPQSASLTAPLTQGRQGVRHKTCTTPTGCETLRFPPMFRYRADAIPVSVQCPCASKKLCKGRWVGVSRAGGVVFFKSVRHRRTH